MSQSIKKWHIIFFIIFLISAVFVKLWQYNWQTKEVLLKGKKIEVLFAKNLYQLNKGLEGRKKLDPYDGMLLIYQFPDRYGVDVAVLDFSIDAVWLKDGEVVDIAPKLPFGKIFGEKTTAVFYPRNEINAILELKSGWAEANNLKIGDKLEIVK